MLAREILKRRSSEIAENVYFASYFCIFKAFKGGNQVTGKGHFARIFEKWGGEARTPCAPQLLRI